MTDLLDFIRPEIKALPESGIVEVVNYARLKKDLVQLWVGEGDQPTPSFIADAAVAALHRGETFYTYQRGIPALRQALSDYLGRSYATTVDPERIFVTVGGMQAIKETVQLLVNPGDEVIVPSPCWPNIAAAVEIMAGVPKPVMLTFGNRGWTLDIERVMEACGPRTKAIFINSPGNPTGWMMSREEQQALLDFARKRGLWIVADEVYGRLVYGRKAAPSFLEIADPDERVIVVNTFSKNWSMTGWRMGWVVASKRLGQVYENLVQYNTSGVATFLQHGAVAALNQGDAFLDETVARVAKGRDMVTETFARLPRVRYAPPAGAFYAFFAVEGEPDARQLAFKLVDEANVGLAPGTAFGPGAPNFLRLCFASSLDRLGEGLARLERALA
ncbi:MAG: pyridoxal phosphate-dependent aminotransferase [Rhodospirillaceae bacterium]|nr:pyridoxal phosphate-dependent aminotransferase [Rhodospirillaceae bacterium]